VAFFVAASVTGHARSRNPYGTPLGHALLGYAKSRRLRADDRSGRAKLAMTTESRLSTDFLKVW
jgi:hypothetical protein